MPTIRLENVAKIYKSKQRQSAAVLDVSLTIEQGEFVFFVGSRGAGKSTLLRIINGELEPDRGAVYLDEINLNRVNRRRSEKLRECMSMVSKDDTLNADATVIDNLMPRRRGLFRRDRLSDEERQRADKALALVGMPGSGDRYVREFNVSECRRIEFARGILYSPSILLLDEITERTDSDTIWDLLHLIREMNERGTTVLMATNDRSTVNIMRKRVITLADGKVAGDVRKGRYGYIM